MRLSISGPLMLAGAGSQSSRPLKNGGGFGGYARVSDLKFNPDVESCTSDASKRQEVGKAWRCPAKGGTADPRWPYRFPWRRQGKSKKLAVFVLNKRNRQFEFIPLRHPVLNVVD